MVKSKTRSSPIIKIDQSFVRNMLDNPDHLAILQGVIGLAKDITWQQRKARQ